MDAHTRANILLGKEMERAFIAFQMETNSKVSGKMAKKMVILF
jgi:hypothetical protein